MMKPLISPVLIAVLSLAAPLRLTAADPPTAASPPAWIKPAFASGLTKIEFYDPAKDPHEFPGWTVFDSDLTYQFDYEYEFREDKQKKYVVTLVPKFSKVELVVRHRIQLPQRYESSRVWESPLAQHELEHVGVGAHRRTVMLAQHLVRKVQRVERTVSKPSEITNDWAQDAIRDEIAPRREALDELLKANNRNLDKLTGHGARPLADRDAFYAEMYLKENLDEMKFPYLHEVLELLEDRDYLAARWEPAPVKPDKPSK